MPPLSISTSWNASRHSEGEPMMEELCELGFTHVAIGQGLPIDKWKGVKESVEKGLIRVTSLDNFCPRPAEFPVLSPSFCQFSEHEASRRQTAVRDTLITVENAASVGAKVVILHLGEAGPRGITRKLMQNFYRGSYLKKTFVHNKIKAVRHRQKVSQSILKRVRECLSKVVEAAQEHKIKLGFELGESFEDFPNNIEMAELLKDFPTEVVGYWHDFGNSAAQDFLTWHSHEETLDQFRNRVFGCHIHDWRAPKSDHLSLGHGNLDFPSLLQHLPVDYLPVLEMDTETTSEEIINSKKLWDSYGNN